MKPNSLLLLLIFFINGIYAQELTGTLKGKIIDDSSGEPLIFATVTLYPMNSETLIQGIRTDFDGNFVFKNVEEGKYDLEVSYVGYTSRRIEKIEIYSNKVTRQDITLLEGVTLNEVIVTEYVVPLISQDQTTTGKTITSRDIRNLPSKSISDIAATTAGVTSSDDGLNIRGSRSSGDIIYVDGIRVEGVNVPQTEIEQIEIITGGVPAAYGDENGSSPIAIVEDIRTIEKPKIHQPTKTNNQTQEEYPKIIENPFTLAQKTPLSTFSIDVDRAAYSNVRRYINNEQLPPKYAVRIEEMINYFNYKLPKVTGKHPVNAQTEYSDCPWNEAHKLLRVSLNSRKIEDDKIPPSNVVFLIDVSGSMNASNKLGLLKNAFKILVNQLSEEDRISIVVYAGAAGLALEPTAGNDKNKILNALEYLKAGGSTAGGAGIKLAYKIAEEQFLKDGNNRIILATDGDFNVGMSSDSDMETLIEEQRKSGIYLTCLGFGMGNYKDSKLEILADKGNGNYAYIDNIDEAKKLFEGEFNATMFAVAKDVKLQLEFNPENVAAYRLIGYENRLLRDEDFENDVIDAGEIGAGHQVTALYEVIPADVESSFLPKDIHLKYKRNKVSKRYTSELLTVKLRYKPIDKNRSKLIKTVVSNQTKKASEDFLFASSVALFGLILRESEYLKEMNLDDVLDLAQVGIGVDKAGYRAEFVEMVQAAKRITIAQELDEETVETDK
ncbi:MAG: YfbK domain-containing protein [Saprospiraceae bacterium]